MKKLLLFLILICCVIIGNAQCFASFIVENQQPPLQDGYYVFGNQSSLQFEQGAQFMWDFGDGTYSYDVMAQHQYTSEGTYMVCLTQIYMVENEPVCTASFCDEITVEMNSGGCDEGQYELTVSAQVCCGGDNGNNIFYTIYNDEEQMVLFEMIHFDGNNEQTLSNVHCLAPGCYTVQMDYSITSSIDEHLLELSFTGSNIVDVEVTQQTEGIPWTLSFCVESGEVSACPDEIWSGEGILCGVMHFEIGSFVEGENVTWYPGDANTAIAGGHFFEYQYTSPGVYEVCAFYTSPACPDGVELCTTITVEDCGEGDDCPESIVGSELDCDSYLFAIAGVETGNVIWTFGDGDGETAGINADHSYSEDDSYMVMAQYSGPGCPDGVMLMYTVNVDCGNNVECPEEIWSGATEECGVMHFEIGSFVEGEDVTWYPGDGTGPIEGGHFLSHVYSEGGNYDVCALYISPACPNGVELCTSIVVEECNTEDNCPDQIWSGAAEECGEMHFEIGNFVEGENVVWYPGDETGAVEGGHFFSHTYAEPGIYNVCAWYTSPACPDGVELCTTIAVDNCNNDEDCPETISVNDTESCHLFHFEIGSFVEGESVVWYFDNGLGMEGGHFIAHEFMQDGVHSICAFYSSPLCPEGVWLCTSVEVDCVPDCGISIGAQQTGEYSYTFTATGYPEVNPMHWSVNGGPLLEATWVLDVQFEGPGTYTVCGWVESEDCGIVEDCFTIEIGENTGCNLNVEVTQQSCELLVLHAFTDEDVEVHWTADGEPVTVGMIATFVLTAGQHQVCAWYETEECGEVVWCETYNITGCGDCTEVNFGLDSYVNEGGPAIVYWILTDEEGNLEMGQESYTGEDPYVDFTFCLEDGCYTLTVEGLAVAEAAFDAIINVGNESVIQEVHVLNNNLIEITFGVNSNCTSSGDCQAAFEPIYTNTPGHIEFINNSTGENAQYTWTFGDGQTGSTGNVWYEENGIYEVCLTIYSSECTDTYCEYVIVTGMEGGCEGNVVTVNVTSDYSSENLFDIIDLGLEYNSEQIESWIVTTNDGFEGSMEACLPDGCYELTLSSESELVADMINIAVMVNGETIDVLSVLNDATEGSIMFGLNADCEDGIAEVQEGSWILYPNPATHVFQLKSTNGVTANRIDIIDATGRTVLTTNQAFLPVDVSGIATGYYMVLISSEAGSTVIPMQVQR